MSERLGREAYMEEVDDESGIVREGTKVTASVAPSSPKEKANSKKMRRSDSPYNHSDSDSTTVMSPRSSSRRREREREKESRSKGKERERSDRGSEKSDKSDKRKSKSVTVQRPSPPRSSKTAPLVRTERRRDAESEYYSVPSTTVTSSRPRAHTQSSRRDSYHPPPQSNLSFYSGHVVPAPAPSPFLATPTSYPPHHGHSYSALPSPVGPPSPMDLAAEAQQAHLKARFQAPQRPVSANAIRPNFSSSSSQYDDYDQENELVVKRRPSVRRSQYVQDLEDRIRMPPPPSIPRSKSVRPTLRAPPPQVQHTRNFVDDDILNGDSARFRDVSPRAAAYEGLYNPLAPLRTRRGSVTYEMPDIRIQPATSSNRRHSYYGKEAFRALGSGAPNYETKLHDAARYQESVNGGGLHALTKEALHKATKRSQGGSSRSTRSSESRDESDWRHSTTTRTTRSSGDDDLTIKVTGLALVDVSGTKIQCQEGGQITISSRQAGASRTGGSDKGSSVYDDRQSRAERPQRRVRAASQSNSYTRTNPRYGGEYVRGTATAPYWP